MKTQIKEVQDYFINKIVAGDYEVLEVNSKHVAEILIDKDYFFSIWIGTSSQYLEIFRFYFNFMQLPDFTTEQQEILFERFSKLIFDKKQQKIKELEEQLNELKNE